MYQMGNFKSPQIDAVHLQNVSFVAEGFDPVLSHVDFDLPLDQNVLIQSSNPNHGLHFLQILSGQHKPQSGCIKWNEKDLFADESSEVTPHVLVGCYFDHVRPHPEKTVLNILLETGLQLDRAHDILEQFEFLSIKNKKFGQLTYEHQKTIQLIAVISREPQMLLLEDPAMGLSEFLFLEVLDLIQYGQRRGSLRHIYLTNHHPTAMRHMDVAVMHLEDGLLYFEEKMDQNKIFNF